MLSEEPGKLETKTDKKPLKSKDLWPLKELEEKLSLKPKKNKNGKPLKNLLKNIIDS